MCNRWASNTPLRQFRGVPVDVIRKAEGKQFVSPFTTSTAMVLKVESKQPWYRYFDLVSFNDM